MRSRPLSISILGWLLILWGLFFFAMTLWFWLTVGKIPGVTELYNEPGHGEAKRNETIIIVAVIGWHLFLALFNVGMGLLILGGKNRA